MDNEPCIPNPEYMNMLLEFGISQRIAEYALIATNNESLDQAMSLAFDIAEGEDNEELPRNLKMTFIVNTSLNMGVGKVASQVAHAALNLYQYLSRSTVDSNRKVDYWQDKGEKKIVLAGNDEAHLQQLEAKANRMRIPSYAIKDAGLTHAPRGSFTVLALFGADEEIDQVTKGLRLL